VDISSYIVPNHNRNKCSVLERLNWCEKRKRYERRLFHDWGEKESQHEKILSLRERGEGGGQFAAYYLLISGRGEDSYSSGERGPAPMYFVSTL